MSIDSDSSEIETLVDLVAALGERDGLSLLQFTDESSESYTARELYEEVRRVSSGLTEKGLERGDRVMLAAPASPAWVICALGALHAGCTPVPLNDEAEPAEVKTIVEDCSPAIVFTEPERADKFEAGEVEPELYFLTVSAGEEGSWEKVKADSDPGPSQPEPGDRALLFYTSGTTGAPKGVPLTHENLLASVRAVQRGDLTQPGDRMLLPLPLHHVYPFVVGFLTPLYLNIPVVMPEARTGPALLRAIEEAEVSIVIGVPRLYRAFYQGIRDQVESSPRLIKPAVEALVKTSKFMYNKFGLKIGKWLLFFLHSKIGSSLRLFASGGSQLPEELARNLEGIGWKVAVGYGLTETSPLLSILGPADLRFDTVGQPLPDVEVKVVPTAAEGEDEASGEILVKGPNVFSGYYNRSDLNKEVFEGDEWFKTGDVGELDDENHLVLNGRVSTMIVTESGKNIHPDSLEDVYAEHPAVDEIGVLSDSGTLAAVVVPDLEVLSERGENDPRDAISAALSEAARELPGYKQISEFVLNRRELPRTRLGKIRRHQLEDLYEESKAGAAAEAGGSPTSPEEMSEEDRELLDDDNCREVWEWLAERFSDYPLEPDTNLQFDLGVDSLEWVNLTLKVSQLTGVELDEEALAEIRNVRDLLEEVAASRSLEENEISSADLFSNPREFLEAEQEKWLDPLGFPFTLARWCLYWSNRLISGNLFRVSARGINNLPDAGSFVIASNHLSYLDPFVLASLLDYETMSNTYWAAWEEAAFSGPTSRLFSRLSGALPIDPVNNLVSSLAFGAAALQEGGNLAWFPEGRRSPDGELQNFQPGLGMLLTNLLDKRRLSGPMELGFEPEAGKKLPAIKKEIKVVPVWIEGTYEALPPGSAMPAPRSVTVKFGQPVRPDDLVAVGEGDKDYEAFTAALRSRVSALGENFGAADES